MHPNRRFRRRRSKRCRSLRDRWLTGPAAAERRLALESLECRRLLASDWHNSVWGLDVNADDKLAPNDALLVINRINRSSTSELPPVGPGDQPPP